MQSKRKVVQFLKFNMLTKRQVVKFLKFNMFEKLYNTLLSISEGIVYDELLIIEGAHELIFLNRSQNKVASPKPQLLFLEVPPSMTPNPNCS